MKRIMQVLACAIIPFITSATPIENFELPDELGLIALSKKESKITCLNLDKNSSEGIRDLCTVEGDDYRDFEYVMCSPDREQGETSNTHYIFQTEWSDKVHNLGQRLTNLYLGFGENAKKVSELQNITLIDDALESVSGLDVQFNSLNNGLYFDLAITDEGGYSMDGTITDYNTNQVSYVRCRDTSLMK
jgi:hypothetical protein